MSNVHHVFGSGIATAVRGFQSARGLGVDGIVGPTTWRNLVWHYDYPGFTNLCDQNPDGNGNANWGTGAAIGQLERAAAVFAGTGQGRVPLGDIGFEHGGPISGHASHQVGLDVDVWPIRTDNAQCTAGRITWQSGTYDRAATRQLVQAVRNAAPRPRQADLLQRPTADRRGPDQLVSQPRQPPAHPVLRGGPPQLPLRLLTARPPHLHRPLGELQRHPCHWSSPSGGEGGAGRRVGQGGAGARTPARNFGTRRLTFMPAPRSVSTIRP